MLSSTKNQNLTFIHFTIDPTIYISGHLSYDDARPQIGRDFDQRMNASFFGKSIFFQSFFTLMCLIFTGTVYILSKKTLGESDTVESEKQISEVFTPLEQLNNVLTANTLSDEEWDLLRKKFKISDNGSHGYTPTFEDAWEWF